MPSWTAFIVQQATPLRSRVLHHSHPERLWSPALEPGSAPSGFLMPGDVKFEARVALS